jgi:hypothetical protein
METSVKRINRLFALGAVAVLASQACNSSPPGGKSFSANSDLVAIDGGVVSLPATPVAGALQVSMSPAALPGTAFEVDVSLRNANGVVLDVSDVVTLTLATTPVVGATMGGTLSRAAVHGVAAFPDLTIASVGSGFVLGASSSGVAVTTTAVKSAAFKVAYSEDDQLSVGGVANTSVAAAQAISPNVPVFGQLGAGEVHYFKFTAKAAQAVGVMGYSNRVDVSNWDTSLRIRLLASNGTTEIARSGAVSANANGVDTGVAVLVPTAGTYYLACDQDQRGFASGKFGVLLALPTLPSGLMQVEAEAAGTVGSNDTAATAETLVAGAMYGHYDNPSTNVSASDYYKISITAPTRVHLEIVASRIGAANGGVLWDPAMTLQSPTGVVLWTSDNTYYLDPAIDYIVTTAGTYYVRVTRSEYATNTGSSPYFLYYAPTPYAPVVEAAAASTTAATAPVISYNTDVSGSFTAAGTQYFSYTGTAGDIVRLTLQDNSELQSATGKLTATSTTNTVTASGMTTGTIGSPSGSALAPSTGTVTATPVSGSTTQVGTVTGPVLSQPSQPITDVPVAGVAILDAGLLGSDAVTALAVASATSTATESKLNTKQTILQATGKYYVKVTGSAAGKFGFRLDLVTNSSREIEPNDTAATATAIGANGWSSGVIATSADKDHFKIHGELNQLVTVSVLAAAGGGIGTALSDWGSALVPVITIRDGSGNIVASTSADRKGLTNFAESTLHTDSTTETSFRAPAGADYDVTVSDADAQGGAGYFYALHVVKNQ